MHPDSPPADLFGHRHVPRADANDMSHGKGNDKAAQVLEAARAVFLAHGFSAATTDMIQSQAGVSKATVYAHYQGKEALFVAVIEAECATLAAHLRAIPCTDGIGETTLESSLRSIGQAWLAHVLSPDGLALFRVVVADAPRFPALGRAYYLAASRIMNSVLAAPLARAARDGVIDITTVGLDAAAGLFVNLLRAEAQMQCLTHPDAMPSAVQKDQWVDLAVLTFLRAFGARDPGPGAGG